MKCRKCGSNNIWVEMMIDLPINAAGEAEMFYISRENFYWDDASPAHCNDCNHGDDGELSVHDFKERYLPKHFYEDGKCPDCAEIIPDDCLNGQSCKNCGHIFWMIDDAEEVDE